jgi:hypothetical protein
MDKYSSKIILPIQKPVEGKWKNGMEKPASSSPSATQAPIPPKPPTPPQKAKH